MWHGVVILARGIVLAWFENVAGRVRFVALCTDAGRIEARWWHEGRRRLLN